jgi:hypothetical protein
MEFSIVPFGVNVEIIRDWPIINNSPGPLSICWTGPHSTFDPPGNSSRIGTALLECRTSARLSTGELAVKQFSTLTKSVL